MSINPVAVENLALPDVILAAFRERPYISFGELAKLLVMNRRTLQGHIDRVKALPWRQKGSGSTKPRRVFTLSDVAVLFDDMAHQQREIPCHPVIKFRPRPTPT